MIFIGSDHAGFEMKEAIKWHLENTETPFEDLGAHQFEVEDDYPDIAKVVCERIQKEGGKGILVCGTGQGMTIAANKFRGIRASLCWNEATVKVAAEHNDANVIALPGRIISKEEGVKLVKLWLKTSFSKEERHNRRITKIKEFEKGKVHL
ncbi:MAG: RpiB/LacA/LacB family sugar-phosphate isomerase [Candidatus Altiarchaeota archaeon]|nr:RpiB/LacA/LacB family sugar-phosphate isomerase [Candidatus Altiarchaeota archaeon]